MKILLDAGADPSIADKYGDSSLHAAINGQCSTRTIQEILDHGARVNAVNKDGATPLLLACSTAHVEAVKFLLKAKADPNLAYADGDTSLHVAIAADCSKETIQDIIDHGAEVNTVNKRGRTALLLGCFYRQIDSVKVLLEAGADPSIADEEGFSCLHAAVDGYCNRDTLQALIDHDAHIDATRKDGTNALLRACTTGQSDSVMFLLQAKADVNITKPNGNTCLHEEINRHCNGEALQKIVLGGVNVTSVNNKSETALVLACYTSQAESITLLLQNGADPNISDAYSYTCLHAAVHGCCPNETLREIIIHEAQLDAQNVVGETALWLACRYRQQDSIKILLKNRSNPNVTDDNGGTCLHAAVIGRCSKNIVSTLLDHGAYVNATSEYNITVLMLACRQGNKAIINVLLNAGADPNITDFNRYTCLHYAGYGNCSEDVLRAIIDHGADVNATSKQKKAALMWACEKGNVDAINVLLNAGEVNKDAINALLNAGADPNIPDANGDTCLHYAARNDCCTEVLQTITSHATNVNTTNKNKVTVLMVVCAKGNKDAINVILNTGADPNIADANGDTCLHYATQTGCCTEVLQAIISHGVDVNSTNKYNVTALMIACGIGNKDAINILLNVGADTNIADADGLTFLHHAVYGDCGKEVLQAVICHAADVNATKNNVTALMIACGKGNKDVIDVILSTGGDPNIIDANGDTCLHYAVRNYYCTAEVLQAIIGHGVDVNATNKNNVTALMAACEIGNKNAIDALLNAGADPNIIDANGDTSLHYAARKYCTAEVLQTIISHGVDVNATNKNNVTALMIVCGIWNKDAIDVLLNAGADPNIIDANGDTCLQYAARNFCTAEVLQAIISHGVDVNATNKNNVTALMIVCGKGKKDVINVVLNVGAELNIIDANGDTCLHYAARNYYCTADVLQAIISHGVDVNATNKNNVTALMITCEMWNKDALDVLLNAGADPNIIDANGDTSLHYAARNYCTDEVLQAIISHGVDVNATNKNNVTALMIACEIGNKDAIDVLLNAGGDPNIVDANADTCLQYAARNYCTAEVLQAIISHGVDVNATNTNNVTALMIACEIGNKDAIDVLLNAGGDHNIANADGGTWLHHAVCGDCSKEALQTITCHGVDVNATDKYNITALTLASGKGNIVAINVLLNAGADPNIADADGGTWLHYAAYGDCSKDVLQSIINHGADVDATNKKNVTALMLACGEGNKDAINVILNAGADPNITDANGDTCLHYAARNDCCTEVLQATIGHNVDVNAANKKNITALMQACEKGNKTAINVLLNAGADPNIADSDGNTCLYNAVGKGYSKDVLEAIISHGADVNVASKKKATALMLACQKGNIDAMHALLHSGANVNATDNKKQTALMLACQTKNENVVNVLLKYGADPNISDADDESCLRKAIIRYSYDIIQALIDHKANVNATNKHHRTALMLACHRGNEDAINVLLNVGADPNIADADGATCLHEAVIRGCSEECVREMIYHGADVNATNSSNQSVILFACHKGNNEAIKALLDPNMTDDVGNTCLHNSVFVGCNKDTLYR